MNQSLMNGSAAAGLIAGATMAQFEDALKKSPKLAADPRLPEYLQKSTFAQSASATSGLTFYDLELGAKFLYPVLTPLRNEIPRVSGKGGIQAAWRAVTGINTTGIRVGVSGGNRGAVMAISTADYTAAYKGIGIEDNVDFEAQYAGEGFDDIRAIAGKVGLEALMLGEEILLLGGNTSLQLAQAGTPSVTVVSTGGTLSATQYVRVVALTLEGFLASTVAGGVPGAITRNNADGTTDTFGGGSSQISSAATATVSSGTTNSITATVAAKRGAVGYAWFWGATNNTTVTLGAITTVPALTITAAATGTQQMSTTFDADNSTNSLVFDGLLTQALKSGSNAYYKDLAGAALTSDGAGGVVEIDAMLKDRWDNYRLSPDTMWVSSQEAYDISKLIMAGNSNGAYRMVFTPERDAIGGGIMVTTYLNRFSMGGAKTLNIRIHPNMPSGTILFTTSKLPYPLSNVGNVFQVRTRQDYYQIEWLLRTRKYEYGVYADEVLQHYFPPSMAVLTGIGLPS